MGNQSRNGRLGAAVAAIKRAVVALKCEVCGKLMGYAEKEGCSAPEGPACYCSTACIREEAEKGIS